MSITFSDWAPGPETGAHRTGIGAMLAERGVRQQQSLREKLPSIAISMLVNGAMAWLLLAVSMTAVNQVKEMTITVSITPTEVVKLEPPPPPKVEKLPDMPTMLPQVAAPQIEIAAPPSPVAIHVAPISPPPQPQQEKAAEDVPLSPPRFDAAYLNNPQPIYPNMSRRLREVGTVQLRVRVSTAGLPLDVQMNKSSGYARLDEAALAAVKKYKFQPATRSGSAVEAWVLVPFEFSLGR